MLVITEVVTVGYVSLVAAPRLRTLAKNCSDVMAVESVQ